MNIITFSFSDVPVYIKQPTNCHKKKIEVQHLYHRAKRVTNIT